MVHIITIVFLMVKYKIKILPHFLLRPLRTDRLFIGAFLSPTEVQGSFCGDGNTTAS